MSYRVLWIPTGTFLLPATEAKIAELEKKGARIVRGELKPDWPSPLEKIGRSGKDVHWYQRTEKGQDVFFVAEKDGRSAFVMPICFVPRGDYPAGATKRVYSGRVSIEDFKTVELDLGKVRDWATVKVNGQVVEKLWCRPYSCDVTESLKSGENAIEVEVTSTIYNQLVIDAGKPESERKTWTMHGPKAGAPLADAGLYGPVTLKVRK